MNLTEVLRFVDAITSAATVIIAFLAWRQIRLLREQARTTFEDSLTEHYRRIMENIPTDVWLGLTLETLDRDHHDRCRDAIYRYIDLSNEEAVLHDNKRVTEEAWKEWSEGIRANMKLPAFREVWAGVGEKSPESFKELRALVGG